MILDTSAVAAIFFNEPEAADFTRDILAAGTDSGVREV